ncbi:unnamed protein product [Camellia sinensis]
MGRDNGKDDEEEEDGEANAKTGITMKFNHTRCDMASLACVTLIAQLVNVVAPCNAVMVLGSKTLFRHHPQGFIRTPLETTLGWRPATTELSHN